MKFKTFQLIVNGKSLNLPDLKKIYTNNPVNYEYGSEFFIIESEIKEDRFLWLYCQYDNKELYNPNVWNSTTNINESNPKSKHQIECRYQLFICYDLEKELLFMNNIRYRNFLSAYLTQIFSKEVLIKNIYGLDAPDRMYTQVDYDRTPIAKMLTFFKTLKNRKNTGEFENIVIVGEDIDGIEQSFDFSSIISAIEIKPQKDSNGHYPPQEVQSQLLHKIR